MWFIKKKSKEQLIEQRVNNVFTELTSEIESSFTELETVQILNDVRRKLDENLGNKESEFMSRIVENNQKLKELKSARDYLK